MARRLTNNDSLIVVRQQEAQKSSKAKDFFLGFLDILDTYYPYDYDMNLNRYKNKYCHHLTHFDYICSKVNEQILEIEDFRKIVFMIFEEKFYKINKDNYNSLVKYFSNLLGKNTSKTNDQKMICDRIKEFF